MSLPLQSRCRVARGALVSPASQSLDERRARCRDLSKCKQEELRVETTMNTYVMEMPRRTKPLFRGSLGACTRFIAGQTSPGMTRLALIVSAPVPDRGPDAAVCVPALVFGEWEEHAAKVVADWEARWLLIESMPSRHRDEARADLLHTVASALVAAAINGVDSAGRPDELLF